MVEHIVLFAWKPDTDPAAIQKAVEGLRALKGRIPGVVDLTCGANFSDRGKNFTHGLVVRLTDRAALEIYGPHPLHQEIVQSLIRPILAESLAIDYEF